MKNQSPFTAHSLNVDWAVNQTLEKVIETFSHIDARHVEHAYYEAVGKTKPEVETPPVIYPPQNTNEDDGQPIAKESSKGRHATTRRRGVDGKA